MARIDREQLGELLSGYIDGELDPRERQIIERVLREDESARQLLADLRRTAQAVSSLPRHAAPASILRDTQATLERSALLDDLPEPRAHQTRGRSSWAGRLAMAAMVGLVLVTGWWFTTEQSRRGSKNKTELARREVRDAAPISVPTTIADRETGRGAAVATVEQQLAAGVDPTSFRSQTFAAEPVRLQVMVRDRSEREALAAKVSAELSKQQLSDLAVVPGWPANTKESAKRFYYRGKTGVNFEAADEDQILVRASPQQIDQLLTGLSQPNQPEEAVALVAGPIMVQGVEKSRSVVQLLGEQQQGGASRSETKGDGGLVGGLLKVVGIDPKLLSSEAESVTDSGGAFPEVSAEESTAGAESNKAVVRSAGSGALVTPPAPSPLVERRLHAATQSSRGSGDHRGRTPNAEPTSALADASVTLIIQIIEAPRPAQSSQPTKAKPDPPASRKVAE